MKMSGAHTSVLVFLTLYLGVTAVTTVGDETRIKIFSSLQDGNPVHRFLAPYPAGANLTLTCNARADKPQWWEWSERIGSDSISNRDTGINTVKFNIPALSHSDHGRQLTCTAENETIIVAIHVIDEIPALELSHSSSNQRPVTLIDQTPVPRDKKTTLTCTTKGLDRLLDLCWFDKNREIKCQERRKTKDTDSVTVDTNDVSPVVQCRPKLKHGDGLSAEALDMFEKMFNDAKREVQITNTESLPELEISYEIRGGNVTIPGDNKTVNLQANETRLTCQTKSNNEVELCWDSNNRTIKCQAYRPDYRRTEVVVSVSRADNGSKFVCRALTNDGASNIVQQDVLILFSDIMPHLKLSYKHNGQRVKMYENDTTVNLRWDGEANLVCQTRSREDLVLCWDRNNITVICQIEPEKARKKVVVNVSRDDDGSRFVCRLKRNDSSANVVQRELHILYSESTATSTASTHLSLGSTIYLTANITSVLSTHKTRRSTTDMSSTITAEPLIRNDQFNYIWIILSVSSILVAIAGSFISLGLYMRFKTIHLKNTQQTAPSLGLVPSRMFPLLPEPQEDVISGRHSPSSLADHSYYYPEITEEVKQKILSDSEQRWNSQEKM